MKGLMVTLLLWSCTGMVFAQQDFNSGRRTGDANSSSLNNQDDPVVPIVSGGDSSAAAITSSRGLNERDRSTFPNSAARAAQSRRTLDSSRQQPEPSQGSFQGGSGLSGGSSSSSFDPSRSTRSTYPNPTPVAGRSFPARDTGLTQVARTTSLPNNDDKVIYLGLPAAQLVDLQRFGSVEAEVRNSYVDRITISDQDRPKATPIRQIEPVLQGDKLVFRFNEEQISHLADYAFEFNVPDYMKGKYSKAVIEYPPAMQRASQANPRTGTGTGTNFQSDDDRWRLAGDLNPKTVDPLETERLRQRELLNRQYEIDRQRAEYERLQRENQTRQASELAEQKRLLDQRTQADQLARYRYEQEQAASRARQGLLPATTPSAAPTWPSPLVSDRFADRRFAVTAPVQQPVGVQPNESLAVSLMQSTLKRMEDRVAQLDSNNRLLGNEMNAVKNENNELRRRFDYEDGGFRRDLADQRPTRPASIESNPAPKLPERPLMSTGGFDPDRRQQAGAGGIDEINAQMNRKRGSWDLLMFLMLLMSVGLNLYLWALSRGFYMRYQELADELRETFAVTT